MKLVTEAALPSVQHGRSSTGRSRVVRYSTGGAEQMSDLVVIAFPTEAKAEEVRQKLLAMQREYLIELGTL
jgi:hypothetical protein